MKPTLERRLGRALLSFGAALAVTYLFVVPQVVLKTEDAVLLRLAAAQLERLRADPAAELPAPMFRLSSRADVEPRLRQRLLALPVGVHECNDEVLAAGLPATDLMIGVAAAGDAERIVVHDVAELEVFDERIDAPGYYTLVLAGAAVSLALALVGLLTARRVFRSLRSLGRLIATADRDEAARMLLSFDDDEIGVLAHRQLVTRDALELALQRERHFTRDTSHELRTPVAVAAGAVELLERELGGTPRARELLQRLRSAHRRIEELVAAFLWLARTDRPEGEEVTEPAARIVARVLETIEQQEGRRLSGVQIDERAALAIRHVPPLGDVVLRNLLHNAIRHGDGETVAIGLAADGITIANPEADAGAPSTREHGFGTSIVADLCHRLAWQLAFERQPGSFVVRIATGSTKS